MDKEFLYLLLIISLSAYVQRYLGGGTDGGGDGLVVGHVQLSEMKVLGEGACFSGGLLKFVLLGQVAHGGVHYVPAPGQQGGRGEPHSSAAAGNKNDPRRHVVGFLLCWVK